MIEIKNLYVTTEGKEILKGVNLCVLPGQIHAIMGPNGAGKSTLARVMAGHPDYEVTQGEILFEGQNIVDLDPEERAQLGLFMSFQYPLEIPGITNVQFLHAAYNATKKMTLTEEAFTSLLSEKMDQMGIKPEFKERHLNTGFSGGEKKRNEVLQLRILDPKVAILDETDSGLDIDAMRIVAEGVNQWMEPQKGLVLITHYQRLLDYIRPHVVHVLVEGRIVTSGGPELALELEQKGYAAHGT